MSDAELFRKERDQAIEGLKKSLEVIGGLHAQIRELRDGSTVESPKKPEGSTPFERWQSDDLGLLDALRQTEALRDQLTAENRALEAALKDAHEARDRWYGQAIARATAHDDAADLKKIAEAAIETADQLQVQLAGCLTAAEGGTHDPVCRGDYGWSQAYAAVLALCRSHDALVEDVKQAQRVWDLADRLCVEATPYEGNGNIHGALNEYLTRRGPRPKLPPECLVSPPENAPPLMYKVLDGPSAWERIHYVEHPAVEDAIRRQVRKVEGGPPGKKAFGQHGHCVCGPTHTTYFWRERPILRIYPVGSNQMIQPLP